MFHVEHFRKKSYIKEEKMPKFRRKAQTKIKNSQQRNNKEYLRIK